MSHAQLKKSGSIERVKGFTNGSVSLMKSTTEKGDVYSLTLRNNSKFHDDVNLLLGDKDNGSLKFEITAKRLYAASQRVL